MPSTRPLWLGRVVLERFGRRLVVGPVYLDFILAKHYGGDSPVSTVSRGQSPERPDAVDLVNLCDQGNTTRLQRFTPRCRQFSERFVS